MVHTRGTSAFQQQFPLIHALVSGDSANVASLCTPQEAAKCGPGGLSVVMVALLLGADEHLLRLLAAGAPLDATLTLKYSDSELHKWLAAAQLTDRAVFRKELVPGRTALHMAAALDKPLQAMMLVTAGAGLGPLLLQRRDGMFVGALRGASTHFGAELRGHALRQYSGDRLAAAPDALLGQLARLAFEVCQPDTCLVVLKAAAQRSVQLSDSDAGALLNQAAAKGQVQVAMHVVKHSPHSIWGLLATTGPSSRPHYAVDHLHPSFAAKLFPYLAQQFVSGKLEMPDEGSLELLIERAMQAKQPAAALDMLQAAQNQAKAHQLEQQHEQPREHRQQRQHGQRQGGEQQRQRLLLSVGGLSKLFRVAASRGHTGVVRYLLQQGTDVLPLFLDNGRPRPIIDASVAPLIFSHLAQQYAAGSLPALSSRDLPVVLLEAVRRSQPDACIRLLCTAAARQSEAQTAAAASAIILWEAALHGQPSVVMHVAHHFGASLLWPIFEACANPSSAVVHDAVLHIAGQVSAGTEELDTGDWACLCTRQPNTMTRKHVQLSWQLQNSSKCS